MSHLIEVFCKMQSQTLDRYFTAKRRKSQVEGEGDLQDQPASSRLCTEEAREDVAIASSSTNSDNTQYMSTGEPCIRHAKHIVNHTCMHV